MKLEEAVAYWQSNTEQRYVYQHALTVLSYDAETAMPAAGAERLGITMGALSERQYELLTETKLKEALEVLLAAPERLPLHLRREAEELRRLLARIACIPKNEYGAFASARSRAGAAWRKARETDDWDAFQPHLQELLETSVRFKHYYDPTAPAYDLLLDDYEHGLRSELLDDFFARLKSELVSLLRRIQSCPQPDDAWLCQPYPLHRQQELAHYLMEVLTLDADRCSLGISLHPFTTSVSNRDVRITTHFIEDRPLSSLFSVLHEGGHALYMLHTADELNGLTLMEGASYAVHEAMSRFMENIIGRSPQFCRFIFPKLQELFPEQTAGHTAHDLWRACNRVQASLIRTEADELTYPLHITVRYELEKRLVAGDLKPDELPGAWNRLYGEILGVRPTCFADGVLQDMHWSDADFGYFPTYALGSAYAAQILHAMEQELDVWGAVEQGSLQPVVEWLREKLYRFGGAKSAAELLTDISGQPFEPRFYLDYLQNKYRQVYGL